ncbi:SAM-dependent methyltransferase [Jiangella alkaliphila]|uniref:Cyclopropane-fatty-acyl-phospholipid synthase n=1 Tax=Jiangella alkaliphila TaxID=419479 RepID=A0A1H2LFE7_9ACTN|nr:cyclopropane-fatty-acyl-phospholipid synthase family protein [Jiangella alkaliphila]SDU79554.1 cyclopropane-fatty-acyl-phospholipid synthase [Jiangella alkaliphila]
MTTTAEQPTTADQLNGLLAAVLGAEPQVRVRAWDGSLAGPADAPVVVIRSPMALRRMLWRPGELGLARAYVAGELDVEGDLGAAFSHARAAFAGLSARPRPGAVRAAWRAAREWRLAGAPPPPPEEARLRGRRHTRRRDRAAISHHYDLGNDFYELLLDETMAYSCGYWSPEVPDGDGAAASRAKLDLVCRKLELRPGDHLVDIGCGWGSLVVHAAREYGVRVTGYTISREQASYVQERIERAGLGERATVRLRDYREIDDTAADAVASIEMGEHVGRRNYPEYAAVLHRTVRPGGRLLLQQMSRGPHAAGGGAFIEAYIAPDMHMRPLPDTLRMIAAAGFELRHVEALREHYVRTVRFWAGRLEEHWAEVVALAGERTARVWRLYLAGGAAAFEEGRMGVDQVLAVRH